MSEKEAKKNGKANHAAPGKGGDTATPAGKASDAAAPAAVEAVSLPKAEYEALKARAAERDAFSDKYVRAHAEFENARKRIEEEKTDYVRYATDGLVMELLPVVDNLELSEKYIKEAKDFKAVQQGLDMIHIQIQKLLKDIGVERIKTVGEKFDPHVHDPLETEETGDADKDDGRVVAELKPGYTLNGRLLRPASVRIIKRK